MLEAGTIIKSWLLGDVSVAQCGELGSVSFTLKYDEFEGEGVQTNFF